MRASRLSNRLSTRLSPSLTRRSKSRRSSVQVARVRSICTQDTPAAVTENRVAGTKYRSAGSRIAAELYDELADVGAVEQHVDGGRQLLEALDDGLQRLQLAVAHQL